MRTLVRFLGNRYMVERTAQRLGLTPSMGDFHYIRDRFIKRMDISVIDNQMLTITVYAYSNELAQIWPEALLEEFADYASDLRIRDREKRIRTYKKEMDELQKRIDEHTEDIFTFEEENQITETFIEQNQLTQIPREIVLAKHKLRQMERVMKTLDSGTLGVVEQLSVLNKWEQNMEEQKQIGLLMPSPSTEMGLTPKIPKPRVSTRVVMPSMVESVAPWIELDRERRQVLEEIRRAENVYGENHEVMRGLQERLQTLNRGLEVELEVLRNRFDLVYEEAQAELADLQEKMPKYREITRRYAKFNRDFKFREGSFKEFGDAYSELAEDITKMGHMANDEIADLDFLGFTWKRPTPVSPSLKKMLIASMALGIAMALAIPFGLNYLDDTSNRLEDVEEILDIPGLGVVPQHDPAELEDIVRSPVIDANSPNRVMENFRVIRSAIALNKEMNLPTQVILFTSARPQEGKTILSANLAWSFASIHDKTLLIDTDLRRGRMHKLLEADNSTGMSNYLQGVSTLDEVIQKTQVPGLDVITRGPIIPGSTEKLCTEDFMNLVKQLRRRYQRVVIDSPPVLGLSETSSLQRAVDGTVLVVRAEKTPRRELKMAYDLLRKSGAKFFGFVLNSLDLNRLGNYYNYYYYSSYYYSTFDDDEVDEEDYSAARKPSKRV
jgi:capsular exopolysaccharide synthesis family protein